MAKCEVCGREPMRASKLSYRSSQLSRRTLVHKKTNVHRVKLSLNGEPPRKVYICTKCLRNRQKITKTKSSK